MTEMKLKIRQQAFTLTLCTIVFVAVYNFCTWYASSLEHVPSFTFDIESSIPFVPLSIIPYMASGIFFCAVFFSCKNKYQLKILTWRILFAIIVAGLFFITVPLQFSFTKPEVSNSILKLPFSFLKAFDSPFNQSPSLHIVFAFIFWSVFKDLSRWRNLVMIWLIFLGISTLTTYQHHLIDVLTGAILAHVCFIIIPYRKNDLRYRNLRLANYYFLSGWIIITAALLLNHYIDREGLVLFLPAIVSFIIGYYYQKDTNISSLFVLNLKQNIRQSKKS
ncbi:phosphatase PAP2 family protein [Chryseobacterium chendengshani]|uniref:phosphatase PAP2 family protein n=1 Tax=Chryseobacterium sp. LJ668 TaxID=2864040 RepID=UPI001C687449|nr:phosphatase PAP2 family protein [Chryseobacterium sp. LJ668]MBW8523750.1 phosphatase PAP2 family protein [Chryseobacterium sp. LJ668]QYK16694.1 phosphatase PAP2 family protein [Chryseobacterium sp. LJ668]